MLLESNHHKMSEIGSIRVFDPKSDGVNHENILQDRSIDDAIGLYRGLEKRVLDSKIGDGSETLKTWLYKAGENDPGYFARIPVDCVIFAGGEGHSSIPNIDTLTKDWLRRIAEKYNTLIFIFYAGSVPEGKRISGTITFED